MANVIVTEVDGSRREVGISGGKSLMEAAVAQGVKGIEADCGGACSCATCHVHIDPAWMDRLEPASAMEQSMLEFAIGADSYSRLSCQIRLSDEHDGLVVRVAESQF